MQISETRAKTTLFLTSDHVSSMDHGQAQREDQTQPCPGGGHDRVHVAGHHAHLK
jgi:hypothetical protein